MTYLQDVVERALLKNPNVAHDAQAIAKQIIEFKDLCDIDPTSLGIIAYELGATAKEMKAFLEITHAIYNCHTVVENFEVERFMEDTRDCGWFDARNDEYDGEFGKINKNYQSGSFDFCGENDPDADFTTFDEYGEPISGRNG